MKKAKIQWKKVLAGILVITMFAGYLPQIGNDVQAATSSADFNEEDVVLKVGVMSDIHLSYANYSAETIKNKVNDYAKSVATLNAMSGNDLDVLMLAGDYTGCGMYEQGKTFTTASGAIMEAINVDKPEGDKTQFFFTYGNHDTEWKGQMDYEEWEKLFNEEGLMAGLTYGPEDSGSYKYVRTVEDKTYYFFSIETETYDTPSNTFRVDVLEWLDKELAETPKDAYVYMVSHAPIAETGVYGSDIEYCKNADWATAEAGHTSTITRSNTDSTQWEVSSDIDGVLKKYPQVMYFSGHTHYTNTLESSIMSDMYTAITVSQYATGDLYNAKSNYLDNGTGNSKPGYSLYIEVDGNGNQRITRVNTLASSLVTSVELKGTEYTDVADDPTSKETPAAKVNAYYTDSVSITYNEGGSVASLTPWLMQAPSADGAHLEKYSADARRETPVFGEGELELTKVENTSGETLTIDFTFPTAKCENHYVIRYEFTIYDEHGIPVDTRWILGNWTTNTDGVTEEGKTHKDATTLSYSNTYTNEELAGVTGIYATLTAVNEFGGRSTLSYGDEDNLQNVGIMKPIASDANKNMFDGITADRTYIAAHTDIVTKSFDEKGVATITSNIIGSTQPWTSIRFALSEYKYEKAVVNGNETIYSNWATPGTYPTWYTDLETSDTFVYEADFTVTEGTGYITFQIRTADVKDSAKDWKTDYNGVRLGTDGVSLRADYVQVGDTSTAFKLSADSTKHHIIIVSAPKVISVWIDDILVLDRVSFVPELTERLSSTEMLPTMALYVSNVNGAITNQNMYLYDYEQQVSDDYAATDVNLYDYSKVTHEGTIESTTDATYPTPAIGRNSLGGYAAYNSEAIDESGTFYMNLDTTNFTAKDTVIAEFDFTPSGLDCGSDNSSVQHDISITFRKNNSGKAAIYKMSTAGNWIDVGTGYGQITGTAQVLKEGKKLHCKIVSGPTSVSVYVGGMLVITKTYSVEDMVPYMEIGVRNGRYVFENISIRKRGDSIEGITAYTGDNNLLNETYGAITSSFKNNSTWEGKSDSVVGGNNFYTDLTWMNLKENGVNSGYWTGENFYPFGTLNGYSNFDGDESFVMSALVRVSNAKLSNGTDTYNHRVGMQVANYNEKSLWYFIEERYLHVYATENNVNTRQGGFDLSSIGYSIGDYIRLTTSITPYGFDVYIDGLKVYSYTGGDGTNVSYRTTAYTASGVEARFLDATVHYNVEGYKNTLINAINTYEIMMKGVWHEEKATYDTEVAEIKATYESEMNPDTLNEYVTIINGYIETLKSEGVAVNNHVVQDVKQKDTSFEAQINSTLVAQNYNVYKTTDTDLTKAPNLEKGDTWIFEADVAVSETSGTPRMGLNIARNCGHNPATVMLQKDVIYYADSTSSSGWNNAKSVWIGSTYILETNTTCHVRYVVVWEESVSMYITNGDNTKSIIAPWSSLPSVTDFNPRLYFLNVTATLTNIYVGYDLTNDIDALNTKVSEMSAVDTTGYTRTSVAEFETAYNAAVIVNELTDAYTKAEINAATANLQSAYDNLVAAEKFVSVGDETEGVVQIGVAEGETLPTGYVKDKYIINWNINTYAEANKETYVAKYIDLDMLNVMKQEKVNDNDTSLTDIRYIASVDSLDYKHAGFVFSLTNEIPDIDKDVTLDTTTVYEALWADGELKKVEDIYGSQGCKSTHLFAFEITSIPTGVTIYVRAFVEMNDGTIIYGDSRTLTVSAPATVE